MNINEVLSLLLNRAGASLAVRATGIVLAFALSVVLARVLGAIEFGRLSAILGVTMLVAVAISGGFEQLVVPEVSSALATNDFDRAKHFITTGLMWIAGSTAILGLIIVVALPFSRVPKDVPGLYFETAIVVALVPLTATMLLLQQAVRAMHQVIRGQIGEQLAIPIGVIATAATLLACGVAVTVVRLLVAQLVATGLVTIFLARQVQIGIWTSGRSTNFCRSGKNDGSRSIRKLVRRAVPLGLTNLLNVAMSRADILVLGVVVGANRVLGEYAVASRIAGVLILGLYAANLSAEPRVAHFFALGDREEVQRVARSTSKIATVFAVIVLLGLAVAGDRVLGVFGADFSAAKPFLWLLCVGRCVQAAFGMPGPILIAAGYQSRFVFVMSLSGVVYLALLPFVALVGGAYGVAVWTSVVAVGWSIWLARECYATTGIECATGILTPAIRLHNIRAS